MFGAPASTPFGSTPVGGGGFGQPSTAPAFGSSAAPSAGGGGFGAPAPATTGLFGSAGGGFGTPSTSGFGSTGGSTFGSAATPGSAGGFGAPSATSTFGSTTNSSPFGATAPSPSAFGTTQTTNFGGTPGGTAFGTPSPAPAFGGTSAFGTPAPAPGTTSAFGGGGFGSTTTTSTFGAPTPSSAFGATGGFGAPAPAPGSTGLFGAPAPAPAGGMFGAPATTPGSTFGSSPGGTSLFGGGAVVPGTTTPGQPAGQVPAWAAGQPPMGNGTRQHAYAPTVRNDGQSTITLQTITAMAPYENSSLEELRLQDYALGNRGNAAQPGASPGGGMFGAPAVPGGFGAPAPAPPGGGLFGAPSPAPAAFGASPAPSTGFGTSFNNPAPAPFGAPAPSTFGTPAPAPGGLFGGAPTSTFGQPAPAPTSAFGTPAPGGLFGAPAPSTFGSQPAPAAPATPGLFGAPQPAPAPGSGLFGGGGGGGFGTPTPAPAPGFGGFGSTPGAAPAASTGLFGAPQPASAPGGGFGGFGAAPAPAFGAAPAGGGLFGAPAPGGFGQPVPAPPSAFGAAPSGGLFGGAPTSTFGQPAPAPPSAFGSAPSSAGYGGVASYGAQPAPPAMVHPTGNIMPPATNELVAAQLAAMEEKRKEMEKSDNFQNQPLASSAVAAASESESSAMRSLALLRPSYPVYHAVSPSNAKIRPRGFASPPDNGITSQSISNLGTGGRPMATPEVVAATSSTRLQINPKPKPKLKLSLPPSNGVIQKEGGEASAVSPKNGLTNGSLRSPAPSMQSAGGSDRHDPVSTPQPPSQQNMNGRTPSSTNTGASVSVTKTAIRDVAFEHYLKASGEASDTENSAMNGSHTPVVDSKVSSMVPKLSKPEYQCSPSIAELQRMPPEDLAAVSSFSVERVGVGKIEWEGAVDVRNANLDAIIVIEPKSIQVYQEEENNNTKPAVGTKLNRPAILTMYGIFPREGSNPAKFPEKIKSSTAKMGAELVDFNPDTGVWVLLVKHF
mmetsp:Transcript_45073/g.109622  ORF Transcript_45073/g.109622 Transcript_45073/m.109622 type:complete len:1003 (+) Transcript_45073:1996-5004(+)